MRSPGNRWQWGVITFALMGLSFVGVPCLYGEDPPLPKEQLEDDPPLPAKKPKVTKVTVTEVWLEVKADSAEVRAGDKRVAKVSKGDRFPLGKEKEGYFLITVDGKKGWISGSVVKKIEVQRQVDQKDESPGENAEPRPPEPQRTEERPGKITSPDRNVEVTVSKDGRVTGRNKRSGKTWTLPGKDEEPYQNPVVRFAPKNTWLFIVTASKQVICVDANKGELRWKNVFESDDYDRATISFDNGSVVIQAADQTIKLDMATGKRLTER